MSVARSDRRSRPIPRGRPAARSASHLRVVRPRRAPRRIPFLLASFVLIGLLVTGVVITQALVSQGSFRMRELAREVASLQQANGDLRREVADLSAPERLADEARRLDLVLPEHVYVLTVNERSGRPAGSSLGERTGGEGPGTGAP
jgi:cell division protein FtsL